MLIITYPNADRSLLSTAELRAAAGSNPITDPNLLLLGNYISAAITKACKVAVSGSIPPTLREEGVTESFRLKSRQGYLSLVRKPIVEINSVIENDTVLDPSQYALDANLVYRVHGSSACCRTFWCNGTIEIDYTAGYETVPDDLKYAAIKFVQSELLNAGRDPLLKSKTIEGVSSYEWWVDPVKSSIIPGDVMNILEAGGYIRQFGWMR